MLTANFSCSRCRMRRRVNVTDLLEILQLQRKKRDTCDALTGAKCGVPDDRVWVLNQQVVGLSRFPLHYSRRKVKEEEFSADEADMSSASDHGGAVVGFSHEAKQFYKAQGKHCRCHVTRGSHQKWICLHGNGALRSILKRMALL